MSLSVQIVTPSAVAWKGDADEVQAPGLAGEFGALPGHALLLSATRPGVVTVHQGGGQIRFLVGAGFAEVSAEQLTLLVELCEDAAAVDKAAAAEALAAAESKMLHAAPDSPEWLEARAAADLATARIDA
jgi:F-type H+-transporting ATPase subunit epsilon